MLLTGFDSQILNTLFIDKKLKYHGLIQAFSRTNRIYNDIKRFGNIVSFQDLSEATNQAIALFGDNKTKGLILEQSFLEKMEGLVNEKGQITQIGLQEIIKKLREKFPNPSTVNKDSDKKEFVKLFGKYLQEEACVKYYDEYIKLIKFHCLKEQTEIDLFKEEYNLSNEKIKKYSTYVLLTDREKQDYLSLYNDINFYVEKLKQDNLKNKIIIDSLEAIG
jgi:type I restriction enzyme R subunit